MPLYEYRCAEHGEYSEFQRMDDEHIAECPKCKRKHKRVYSPAKVVVDFRPGWDDGLGQYVSTKKERDTLLRVRNWERIRC